MLTEIQTAGRGRGANTWWFASGSLAFSLILPLGTNGSEPKAWPKTALATAVGVCDALERLLPEFQFGIRWPNDVCFGSRKICGILPELSNGNSPRLVLGIGMNVNNSMDHAPDELKSYATSLVDLTTHRMNLTDVIVEVLRHLEIRFSELASSNSSLPAAWSRRCLLRGRIVQLCSGLDEIQGLCGGIDESGALQIKTLTRLERCYGGTISAIDDTPLHPA